MIDVRICFYIIAWLLAHIKLVILSGIVIIRRQGMLELCISTETLRRNKLIVLCNYFIVYRAFRNGNIKR